MNSVLGQKEAAQAIHANVKSSLLAKLGKRLISLLKWCVIAFVLLLGFTVASVHLLARKTNTPSMQILLARLYINDIWWHPTDKEFAKSMLRKAMAAGDVKAQYGLAREYEKEKNYTEAFPLHQDLALKGFTASQTRLGLMYLDGKGGYWPLGFLAICFIGFSFFIVWSFLHGYQEVDVVDLELTHDYT